MLTMEERKEKVKDHIDPDLFVEVLDISTKDLVDAFADRLEECWDRFEYLEQEVEEYGPESTNTC